MDTCKHLHNLQGLYFSRNHLSGQLPTTLSLCGELLSLLEEMYLADNSLVGSIPTSFDPFVGAKSPFRQSPIKYWHLAPGS
ncbi:hypothetical protein AAG906_022711 [Vitis piasezkii]